MNAIKMVFWPNTARSLKVQGEMATWVGDGDNALASVITARKCGPKAIVFQSSTLNGDDSHTVCISEIGLVQRKTPRSPDYCGIVELAGQGKFKVVAWMKYKTTGDSYIFSLFEPIVTSDDPAVPAIREMEAIPA